MMKIEGVIEAVPVTSTNTEPMQYDLTITGTGTMAECNHVMDLLMQDAPDTEEEKYIVKPDPNTASGIIDPVMIDGVRHYLKQNGKKIYLQNVTKYVSLSIQETLEKDSPIEKSLNFH